MVERLLREKEQSPSCEPSVNVQAEDRTLSASLTTGSFGSAGVNRRSPAFLQSQIEAAKISQFRNVQRPADH
jgi:hypothetical protein